VPGNHEWYAPRLNFNVPEGAARARDLAARLGVHFLMGGALVIDGVRFLGTTLWTDYNFYEDVPAGMTIAARYINDHRMIYPESKAVPLTPGQARAWHVCGCAWLEHQSADNSEADTPWTKIVVVTHHMPHPLSVDAKYASDTLSPAFCSDLSRVGRPPARRLGFMAIHIRVAIIPSMACAWFATPKAMDHLVTAHRLRTVVSAIRS